MCKVTNCRFAHLKLSPEFNAEIAGVVAAGVSVSIVGATNDYYEIVIDQLHRGYIHKDYVKEGGI